MSTNETDDTDGKLAKLPRWARSEIERLRANNASLQAEIESMLAEPGAAPKSGFFLRSYSGAPKISPVDLPVRCRTHGMIWKGDDGSEIHLRGEDGRLRISAGDHNAFEINVRPEAYTTISVRAVSVFERQAMKEARERLLEIAAKQEAKP